ncbi:ComF family protein [Streptococcus orisratti]|uniref:ComF family protein n=1 Tax=Streptococcus orisratti TaxID=114652 RepID=UPI000381668A|nr:ComF family protein [Streptococcus orisratti]
MICLLCSQHFNSKEKFSNLFFLRKSSKAICTDCQRRFERIGSKHCPTCFRPNIDKICLDCQTWQEKGHRVNHCALYGYNEAMKDYFSKYKFQGDMLLSKVFAKQVKKALNSYKGYTIIPVPVSKERYRERQFNQVSALLDAAGISYINLLERKDADKQSSKSRQERLTAKNLFYINTDHNLPEKVLIVDDIYTTGATLQHIVSLFSKHGKDDVKTFSIAR